MFASRYPSPKALSARCDKTPPSEKTFGRRVRAFLSQCDLEHNVVAYILFDKQE